MGIVRLRIKIYIQLVMDKLFFFIIVSVFREKNFNFISNILLS